MKITPDELITFIYEVERKTKTEMEREQEKKPKHHLIIVALHYIYVDLIANTETKCYSEIVLREGKYNAHKEYINKLSLLYAHDDITIVYDPVCLKYIGYKGDDRIFEIKEMHDMIIEKIEV